MGYAVGTADDVNGDGWDDVIVGAPKDTDVVSREGVAYLFHGSSAGLSTAPNWSAGGGQKGAEFGASASTAGDVNGDGYAEVIVGAPLHGQPETGRVYLYPEEECPLHAGYKAGKVCRGTDQVFWRDAGFAVTPALGGRMLEEFRRLSRQKRPAPKEETLSLTPREQQVLSLAAEGATDKEIAKALTISIHTVKSHMRNILAKLHLNHRHEAALFALREGLITLSKGPVR